MFVQVNLFGTTDVSAAKIETSSNQNEQVYHVFSAVSIIILDAHVKIFYYPHNGLSFVAEKQLEALLTCTLQKRKELNSTSGKKKEV